MQGTSITPSEGALAAHRALSERGVELLERVAADPAWLRRSSFAALDRPSGYVSYPLQSWPTFVSSARLRELESANAAVCRLVVRVPERVFGLDPARLAAFYGLDATYAALLVNLLRDPLYMDALVARGDFVQTADGFRCLEMNLSGNLGGWRTPLWERFYTEVPLIADYLEERGIRHRENDTVRALFGHVVERARRRGNFEGELNVAFRVAADNRSHPDVERYAREELSRRLGEEGIARGTLEVCQVSDLRLEGAALHLGARRVHALFEQDEGLPDRNVFRALLAGTVDVYNGPAAAILGDKRNLALLSELAGRGELEAGEREVVASHVPWTRTVRAGEAVELEGRERAIEELLRGERGRLVLKPATAAQGEGVTVGRAVSDERWREASTAALDEAGGPWIVQELASSVPYLYQCGAEGCAEHDMVWGLFVFGETPAGGFLRMMPQGGQGVINAARGASEGVLFEVDR